MNANQLTIDEVRAKYGNVPLLFQHYYKHSFTFKGQASDGVIIEARYVGYSDAAYRFEVTRDGPVYLKDVNEITLYRDDAVIFVWESK